MIDAVPTGAVDEASKGVDPTSGGQVPFLVGTLGDRLLKPSIQQLDALVIGGGFWRNLSHVFRDHRNNWGRLGHLGPLLGRSLAFLLHRVRYPFLHNPLWCTARMNYARIRRKGIAVERDLLRHHVCKYRMLRGRRTRL